MRSSLIGVLAAAALACLGACFIAPGEIASSNITCTGTQRAFNGACRDTCSDTDPCTDATTICANVDTTTSLCLESDVSCSYLGDDTECAGRGGYYEEVGRGTYEVWIEYASYPPYPYTIDPSTLTNNQDPYFTPYGYQPNIESDAFGCQGNSQWISVSPEPGIACSATHTVTRCLLTFGDFGEQTCALVTGTTEETVLPSP